MKREDLSPTVLSCYILNHTWFDDYSLGNTYDPEGYDQYGYNDQGIDRAGIHASAYRFKPAFDEDDHPYDQGWEAYHNAIRQWCAYKVTPEYATPMPHESTQRFDNNVYHIEDVMCQQDGAIMYTYSDQEKSTTVNTTLERIVQGLDPNPWMDPSHAA